MSNNFRHRIEYDKPRSQPVLYSDEIFIGDLVYYDGTQLKPASNIDDTVVDPWVLVTAQRMFASKFRGVSEQHTPAVSSSTDKTHITPISFASGGVFEFPCASATFKYGDLIGVAENAGGDGLEAQKVVAVTDSSLAIGRVAEDVLVAATSVKVEIFPAESLPQGVGSSQRFKTAHTVTAGEDTAGEAEIDTLLGGDCVLSVMVVDAAGITKTDDLTINQTGGVVTIGDGNTNTLDATDVIHLIAEL